ncbi:unnamed protein product [Lampetra fluviatilis]
MGGTADSPHGLTNAWQDGASKEATARPQRQKGGPQLSAKAGDPPRQPDGRAKSHGGARSRAGRQRGRVCPTKQEAEWEQPKVWCGTTRAQDSEPGSRLGCRNINKIGA